MNNLYGTIGESKPSYLLATPGGEMISIPCEPGNDTVKIGTVMYRKESGMYAPASAEECVDTNYLVVLGETVDTAANAEIAEDAKAYRSGCFISGKVVLKSDAALSATEIVALRKQGIVFNPMVSTETFDNKKAGD